ncbi:MAG: HNH endonuclease [Anaeroplasmataceae bacterium]|nr:HNH endonuclease [Anaeroplasmataceae bacterium]
MWYGYLDAHLRKNGKRKHHKVHRLVAEAFIPNPDNLPIVNHKDENKLNNRLCNLEWCTYEYNNTYGSRENGNNYPKGKRRIKCIETGSTYNAIKTAAKDMNIRADLIGRCCKGERENASGYHFEYIDKK